MGARYGGRYPHWHPDRAWVFFSWQLAGSTAMSELRSRIGLAGDDWEYWFAQQGHRWMEDPEIAEIVAEEIRSVDAELRAWVVMPNHVHVVLRCESAVGPLVKSIKGRSARRANLRLSRVGESFWEHEYFDRWMRTDEELNRTVRYVEGNPVKAGLVKRAEDWRWSSAYQPPD